MKGGISFKQWRSRAASLAHEWTPWDLVLRSVAFSALLELPLMASVPHAFVWDATVPWVIRAFAAVLEVGLSTLLLLPCLMLARRSQSLLARWAGYLGSGALVGGVLFSWGTFFGVGHFFNLETLRFAAGNGGQLLKHVLEFNPIALVSAPFLFTGALVLLHWWSGRPIAPRSRRVSGVILFLFGTVLLSLFLATAYTVSSATNISTNRVTGATGLSADFWVKALRSEAGPLITLGNDLAPESLAPGEHWPAPSLKVSERKRLRIPLAAYQAQIPKGSPQYNVLIVLVESLRSDTLTELGSTRVVMPHLEELAARSVVFARAYAQATHSSYSDPTALSSQFPLRAHRYQDYPREIPYPHVLIYELLKPRGYTTAIISSQNELWGGMLHYLKTPALDHLFHAETYHRHYVHEKDSAFAKWTERYQRSGKIDDADTMDELLRFIEETREPFFVYTNLQNSHFPYRYPDPDQAPFQPQRVDFSYTFSHYPPSKVGIVKNRYHNALHFIDSQLGRLFDTLSRLRLWENTIVVITGDTGQAFHEHGRVSHGTTPYEELIHIPIVVSAPDLGSRVSQRLSSQADIPPTILELLGMPPHPAFQGVSMLDNAQRLPVFTMVHVPAMRELAVIDGTMKLIMDGEGKRLLFDLSKDPQEKTNLWARDSEAGQRLLNLLLSYRQTQLQYYGDPTRWNNEYPPVLNLDPR